MIEKIKTLSRPFKLAFIVVLLLLLYFITTRFVIYTEDAFVKVDTVSTASEVEGRVTAVYVKDNDSVNQNQPLIQVDATVAGLSRDAAANSLNEAEKELPVLSSQMNETQADIASEHAHLAFLRLTQNRYQKLYRAGALPLQNVDDINSQVLVSEAVLRHQEAALMTLKKTYQQQEAHIALMKNNLGLAEYTLQQTQVVAKQTGVITSFNTYVGDYLKLGEPLFTIVSNDNWRIIANIKEYRLSDLHVGQKVIVYLSFHPFHLYTGHIQSIGKGVARDKDGASALQYIDPTVDWIRYDYRFPVTIVLTHPPKDLYFGADARVWILR